MIILFATVAIILAGIVRVIYLDSVHIEKYKRGDIVYLKPDSTKVIIVKSFFYWDNCEVTYRVLSNGKIFEMPVPEQLIYEPKNK